MQDGQAGWRASWLAGTQQTRAGWPAEETAMHKPQCGGCRSAAAPGGVISRTKASRCVCGTARVFARDAHTDVQYGSSSRLESGAAPATDNDGRAQLRTTGRARGREMQTQLCLKGRWKILWAYPKALPSTTRRPLAH